MRADRGLDTVEHTLGEFGAVHIALGDHVDRVVHRPGVARRRDDQLEAPPRRASVSAVVVPADTMGIMVYLVSLSNQIREDLCIPILNVLFMSGVLSLIHI